MQTRRMYGHDYTRVGFYMITMNTAGRRRIFGECRDNRVFLSPAGETVERRWHEIPRHRPQIETSDLVVMPDHLHGILYVKEQLPKPLGNTLRGFASGVTSELRKTAETPGLAVWEGSFNDRIIMNADTLRNERKYIRDNPRRYCLRKANPDLFVRVNHLRHPRLPDDQHWRGYGNLFLIERPDLMPVQVSRQATAKDIASLRAKVRERVSAGAVAVSPFISPGEKEIAGMVMARDSGDLILMKPAGFPPLYKPSGAYFDLCAEGRLLVLTAFPYTGRKQTLTRECCLRMNQWVADICAPNRA
ncbi:MAG: transposase [Lentisphaeria bacterium]|nr:transposase [Lentisphaeria bacterium]